MLDSSSHQRSQDQIGNTGIKRNIRDSSEKRSATHVSALQTFLEHLTIGHFDINVNLYQISVEV